MEYQASAGLKLLLRQSDEAQTYFRSLPSYVKELIGRDNGDISTPDELVRHANDIMDGLSK